MSRWIYIHLVKQINKWVDEYIHLVKQINRWVDELFI